MRLVVSQEAATLAQERGGRLYVWVKKGRCCGSGARWLTTSSELPERQEFTSVARTESFELFVPVGLAPLPDELHLEARSFPRRVEAYWDGCAWVT